MQRSRLRGAGFLSGTLGSMIVALAMCNTTLDPHSEPLSHCTAIFHTWETLGPGWHGIAREPGKRQSHEAFRQLQQNGPQRIPDACHRRHFFLHLITWNKEARNLPIRNVFLPGIITLCRDKLCRRDWRPGSVQGDMSHKLCYIIIITDTASFRTDSHAPKKHVG